ncbi:MAG: TIR domain-containing protein [Anaerolineae bacterium]|nr:TIR domain-containing protein [Anaerolineae bacterium]
MVQPSGKANTPLHKHIFISYRSIEAEFALKLAADLRNAGVSIWMDRLDGIHGADDWRRSIEQGLRDATGLLAVMSPDYINSKYCLRELATADELNIPILPVLLRSISNDQYPIEVRRLQFIDFGNWRNGVAYKQKLEQLIVAIQEKSRTHVGEVPDAETRYLNRLIADLESRRGVLDYVELSGETEVTESRPKPHILMDDEFGFSELIQSPDQPEARVFVKLGSIRDALEKHSCFVLIGDAGSSKTTTIRRFALEAARKRLGNPISPLPLFFYLPHWGSEVTADDFIRQQWRKADLLEHVDPIVLLQSGGACLYLDGLNEMGSDGARKAKALKKWIKSQDTPPEIIITCRTDSYIGDFELGIPIVQTEPMSDSQIRQFAENYLREQADSFLRSIMPETFWAKQDRRHLYHLARNPYMLSALIVVFDSSSDKQLPSNNGKLFRMLINALAKREEQRQSPGWVPLIDKFPDIERTLAQLAYTMINNDSGTAVSLSYSIQHLSEEILQAASSANYIELRADTVTFYHQLIQEYFAALHIVKSGGEVPVQRSTRFVGKALADFTSPSDEILKMLVVLHPNPERIIKEIIPKNPYAAFKALLESNIQLPEQILENLVKHLIENLEQPSNYKLSAEYKKLSDDLTYGRFIRGDPHDYLAEREELRNDALREIVSICKCLEWLKHPLAVPQLISILHNEDLVEIQFASASALYVISDQRGNMAVEKWKDQQLRNLKSQSVMARKAAAHAVGYFKIEEGLNNLIALLEDYSRCEEGGNPISYILSHKANSWTEPWYNDRSVPPVCVVASNALEQLGTAEAENALNIWRKKGSTIDLDTQG